MNIFPLDIFQATLSDKNSQTVLWNKSEKIATWLQPHTLQDLNPSNAEATFVQSTMTPIFLQTNQTLSCWYSFESSHWVLSHEYPYFGVFSWCLHYFLLANLATSSKRVNQKTGELTFIARLLMLVFVFHMGCMWRATHWQLSKQSSNVDN